MSVVTLLAVTSCSTMHQMPPSALEAAVSAPDTSKIGSSLKPGRWYSFRGYTDSHGAQQSVSGRVRAVPGDSLEFESYYSSSSSLTPPSHRSVVPRDSISVLRISEFNAGQTLLVVGVLAAVLIFFVVQLRNALKHLEFGVPTH